MQTRWLKFTKKDVYHGNFPKVLNSVFCSQIYATQRASKMTFEMYALYNNYKKYILYAIYNKCSKIHHVG